MCLYFKSLSYLSSSVNKTRNASVLEILISKCMITQRDKRNMCMNLS